MDDFNVFKKIIVVFSGSLLTKAISFLTMLIIVRTFIPEDFALFAIVDTVIGFSAGAITAGLNWWMIRSIAVAGIDNSQHIIRRTLLIQLVYALIVALILIVGSSFIAQSIFHKPETQVYVKISSIGVLGYIVFSFRSALYQAVKKFKTDVQFNVISASMFLIFISVYVYALKGSSMVPICYAHVTIPAVVSIIALLISGFKFSPLRNSGKLIQRIINTAKKTGVHWLLAYSIALWLVGQIHMIVMTSYRPLEEVGTYALALRIYLLSMMITNSINTVLLPQLSSMKTSTELIKELKKTLLISGIICLLVLMLIPFLAFILVPIAGDKYALAIPPLKILFIGTALSAVFSPPVNVLFALEKYKTLAIGGLFLTALSISMNLIFTVRYGPIAAAFVLVGSFFLMNLYFSSVAFVNLKKGLAPSLREHDGGI